MTKKAVFVPFLFSLLVVVELIFSYSADEIKIPLLLSVLLLLLLLILSKRAILIPKSFGIFYSLLILSYLFSAFINGLNFSMTIEIIKLFSLFILTIFLFNIFRENKNTSSIIFHILCLTSAFLALIGIVEFSGRVYAQKALGLIEPFHWPSISASFFLLIAPANLSLFLSHAKSNFLKNLLYASFILLLIAWVLTKQYILILLIIMSTLSLFYFFLVKEDKGLKTVNLRSIFLLLFLLLSIFPNLYASFGGNPIPKEIAIFQNQFYFHDKNDITRFSLEMLGKYPVFGVGPGNFSNFYHNNLLKSWVWSDFAGNELIHTMIETGLLGFTAQFIFSTYIILLCLKKIIFFSKNRNILSLSISLSCLIFFLVNLNNFSLRIFPTALVFYVLLSSLLIEEKDLSISKNVAYIFILPIFIFSLILLNDGLLLNLNRQLFWQKNFSASEKLLSLLSAKPEWLINPEVYTWQSALYLEKGKRNQAVDYLRKAKAINPYDDGVNYQIAFIFYKEGKLSQAKEALEIQIETNPFSPPKYYSNLAKIYLEEKNLPLSLYWLKRASLIYPADQKYKFPSTLLTILESRNYLTPLAQIYLSLYELTNNTKYFNYAIRFML